MTVCPVVAKSNMIFISLQNRRCIIIEWVMLFLFSSFLFGFFHFHEIIGISISFVDITPALIMVKLVSFLQVLILLFFR